MSVDDRPDPQAFYTRKIPDDFNRMLEAQRALGEAGRAVFDAMRAVNATICVEVAGDPPTRVFLDITDGVMAVAATPAHPPFLTVIQDAASFAGLVGETGESLTALLGAMAGLGGDLKLTRKRVRDMEAVDGLIRFEVTGEGGFVLLTQFGAGQRPAQPHATIRVDAEAYALLRHGRLDPQDAFLDGRIDAEGEMDKVMQLAFAAVAPD
ncbi:MAG: SCP2 sterol-binding domain-containing protein [Myxococcota bacterium]